MPLERALKDQAEFWMGVLTTASTTTGTPITQLKTMDVFDFFSLLSVVEKKNKK